MSNVMRIRSWPVAIESTAESPIPGLSSLIQTRSCPRERSVLTTKPGKFSSANRRTRHPLLISKTRIDILARDTGIIFQNLFGAPTVFEPQVKDKFNCDASAFDNRFATANVLVRVQTLCQRIRNPRPSNSRLHPVGLDSQFRYVNLTGDEFWKQEIAGFTEIFVLKNQVVDFVNDIANLIVKPPSDCTRREHNRIVDEDIPIDTRHRCPLRYCSGVINEVFT